jgi:hypothetical protein
MSDGVPVTVGLEPLDHVAVDGVLMTWRVVARHRRAAHAGVMTETHTTATDQLTAMIDRHLEAYALADTGRRNQLIAECWQSDGRLVDPPFEGQGHAEISAMVDVVLTHYAGHTFTRTTVVDTHHEFARYGWALVGPDGTAAVSGTDIVEVGADGRLVCIVGFFGPLVPDAG